MSIGDTLAEARRQSGLTITQVSQRTCIRETIIRGIERGDFSGCGGDFYARGHIRSIASAVGLDPGPLVDEYDAVMGAPRAISAADVFQPVTPVKLKERRRPNWAAALGVAVLLVGGLLAYQHFASGSAPATTDPTAQLHLALPSTHASGKGSPNASQVAHHKSHRLDIRLTSTQYCWIQMTTSTGRTVFNGTVRPGQSLHWTERHAVTMIIGNPAGVKVTVNGKNPVPRGSVNSVTLSLRAGKGVNGKHG